MKLVECKNSHNIYMVMKEVNDVSNKEIVANSVDAAIEKHVPQYHIENDKVKIEVLHVMEEDHYIEWIMAEYKDKQMIKYFKPGQEATFTVDYEEDLILYAYCNKHGLWSNKVKY